MSHFQEKVYRVVKRIPKGKTISYKEVAEKAGFPKAWRAVGNVLNKNLSLRSRTLILRIKNPSLRSRTLITSVIKNRNLDVPCHRVIKSDGKPGGYYLGTKKKIALLRKEMS